MAAARDWISGVTAWAFAMYEMRAMSKIWRDASLKKVRSLPLKSLLRMGASGVFASSGAAGECAVTVRRAATTKLLIAKV
jgi:hypothetical protein